MKPTYTGLKCRGFKIAFHVSMVGTMRKIKVPAACCAYRVARISWPVGNEFQKLRNLKLDLCCKDRPGFAGETPDSSSWSRTFEKKLAISYLLLLLALQPTVGFSLLSDFLPFCPLFTLLSPPSYSHYLQIFFNACNPSLPWSSSSSRNYRFPL